jgi:hypothetical protein
MSRGFRTATLRTSGRCEHENEEHGISHDGPGHAKSAPGKKSEDERRGESRRPAPPTVLADLDAVRRFFADLRIAVDDADAVTGHAGDGSPVAVAHDRRVARAGQGSRVQPWLIATWRA